MRLVLVVTLVLLGALAGSATRGEDAAALKAARLSIRQPDLLKHLNVLASDSFEGREGGSRGGRAAGGYLVQYFGQYGLTPAGDGGYFQTFSGGHRNILGLLEGSDPVLKNEVILVGGHYDHVGYGTQQNSYGPLGYIHNGADDNASGTSGIIEIIEAFSQLPTHPKRSILFVLWDGEEKGLLGSEHWVASPTIPLARLKLAVNVDMIGRLSNKGVEISGVRTALGLRQRVSRANGDLELPLAFSWEIDDNSDHYPFYRSGVPILMLHTGLHDDYHRPSDDVERLNVEGLERTTQLLFNLVYDLANGEAVSDFRVAARRESPANKRSFEVAQPPLPSRLGVRWSTTDEGPGLRLVAITPGSAAASAGLRMGDRMLKIADTEITDGETFLRYVLAAPPEVTFLIQRADAEEPEPIAATLSGTPVRLGISWRVDNADPEAVMLTRVVPGSPAGDARLRPRDRIYAVNGERFTGSAGFHALATATTEPLTLLVERGGRLYDVELAPVAFPQPAEVAQPVAGEDADSSPAVSE